MKTSPATSPTREVDGVELPRPGAWKVDPGHAEVGFIGRHLMFTKVRGRFTDIDASVEIAEQVEDSRVEATIQMASVESGDATRDGHLRSADLFDVDNHPTARFSSTGLDWHGSSGTLHGDLTIKGVTRPVQLQVDFLGGITDPWDHQRAVFDATGRINREDWDITWNMVLETGGLLVSKEIDLVFHVELVRQ
jgi:polyisoprenoid-binding protein YceI